MSKNTMEIDIPNRKIADREVAIGKTQTTCDGCGHTIGSSYAKWGSVSVDFPHESHAHGLQPYEEYSMSSTKHFCGMGCLGSYIDKKDDEDGVVHEYTKEECKADEGDEGDEGSMAALKECHAREISTKKRNHLKSHQFVDEKRRSFPIETCEDVKAAVHAWGRYKGSMSFDEFKAKLTHKAHQLGCTLPASWTEKK